MKLTKTLKIKIGKLSNNKNNILNTLINKNTKAINFCLNKAKNEKITHDLVYKDLRKLNLPSTIIHGCRAKSIEIIKSYRKLKKRNYKANFPELKNSRIRYDNQVVKLRHTNNKLYPEFVSLLYKAGIRGKSDNRIELPLIINSDYQKDIIKDIETKYKLGSTELIKKNNEFYIHISYSKETEIPNPDETFNPIGIDIGINNLAVSVTPSKVTFYSGKRLMWKNKFFRRQRQKLQENLALEEIKRLKARQTKYNNHYINHISKNIIEQAKKEVKPVIVMENLTNINETKVRKSQRAKHSEWVWKRLQLAIQYKALWDNIPVVYINPQFTSQICLKCLSTNKRVKHNYKCNYCGYKANADYVGAKNISKKFFDTICIEEQASINNAFNPNSQELKAERDIGVKNLQEKEDAIPLTFENVSTLA